MSLRAIVRDYGNQISIFAFGAKSCEKETHTLVGISFSNQIVPLLRLCTQFVFKILNYDISAQNLLQSTVSRGTAGRYLNIL